MDQRKVDVQNIGSTDVMVTMGSTEPLHLDLPTKISVVSKGGQKVLFMASDGGCGRMHVWTQDRSWVWCGIVPLSSRDDENNTQLIIDPDRQKVTYGVMDLPECPDLQRPSRDADVLREHFRYTNEISSDGLDLTKVILICVVAITIYGIWKWLFC
jgi:hypothetical protein